MRSEPAMNAIHLIVPVIAGLPKRIIPAIIASRMFVVVLSPVLVSLQERREVLPKYSNTDRKAANRDHPE